MANFSAYDFLFGQGLIRDDINATEESPYQGGGGGTGLTSYRLETGKHAGDDWASYQQWAVKKTLGGKSIEEFLKTYDPSGVSYTPGSGGTVNIKDSILASNMDSGGLFDWGDLIGPASLIALPFAGMMGAFGAAGAGAGAVGAAEGAGAAAGFTGADLAAAGLESGFSSLAGTPGFASAGIGGTVTVPTFTGSGLNLSAPFDPTWGGSAFTGPDLAAQGLESGFSFLPTASVGTRFPLMPPAVPPVSGAGIPPLDLGSRLDTGIFSPEVREITRNIDPFGLDRIPSSPDGGADFLKGLTAKIGPAAAQGLFTKLANGTATADDYARIAGTLGATGLGALEASKQRESFERLAQQYAGYGAPYRERLANLYADPSAFLTSPEVMGPVNQGTKSLAQALSVQGNPYGNPRAQFEIENYAANQLFGRLGQEKDRLGGFGGLSAYNQAAPSLSATAASKEGGVFGALGYGLGQITNPQPSLADLLRQLGFKASAA